MQSVRGGCMFSPRSGCMRAAQHAQNARQPRSLALAATKNAAHLYKGTHLSLIESRPTPLHSRICIFLLAHCTKMSDSGLCKVRTATKDHGKRAGVSEKSVAGDMRSLSHFRPHQRIPARNQMPKRSFLHPLQPFLSPNTDCENVLRRSRKREGVIVKFQRRSGEMANRGTGTHLCVPA